MSGEHAIPLSALIQAQTALLAVMHSDLPGADVPTTTAFLRLRNECAKASGALGYHLDYIGRQKVAVRDDAADARREERRLEA